MISWPDLGTRVTVRYRRPAGSVPPLTDAVGHLLAVDPMVRVRTKTGAVAECAPADVVALRVLTDAPVRASEIRALEHAAAAAWPAAEHAWRDGWLLRAGQDAPSLTNSAVPLDVSADLDAIPAIVAWYDVRGLTPLLAVPDRLLRPPPGLVAERTERVFVRDLSSVPPASRPDPSVTLEQRSAVARAAVTEAPDGTRWVGLSEVRATDDPGTAARLCEALLAWGARRGATRGYLRADDADGTALAESLGFWLHHRTRYILATAAPDTTR
ncbi:GNAT family N-acetyltransferase [Mycobacterium sp. 663a-19]|uniref:GNAT family N-acetyltransferase, cg3035/Rv0428c family n=1 Tax=Mycobacterium sp. 663a-19 TaxID=2986148 RepID=UPI002D1E5C90|nr:GNAT family N-acetyltransferase [Mycobacterium sp. 663a-19]MEB3984101.1 GNAT family N-acetyltransferase [Mycobacterium sp. 663a-19]